MKRLLFVLIFVLLLPGVGWGANKLEVDSTKGFLTTIAKDCDSTYLYAVSANGRQVVRYNTSLAATNGHDFGAGYRIWAIHKTSTPLTIFIMVENTGTSIGYLYISTDGGENLGNSGNPVITYGNGTIADVREGEWNRGFCETNNATYKYLSGEYNDNGARVDGADNDEVALWGSADGITWAKVVSWNTDGSTHQTDHIHFVRYNAGYVYIGFGDANTETALIRWNPSVGIWADNKSHDYWADKDGFAVLYTAASGRYRSVDLLFSGNYCYWMTDQNAGTARGIWRAGLDLSSPTQVDTQTQSDVLKAGWIGIVTSTGTIIFTDNVEGADNAWANVWASNNGTSWTNVAKLGFKEASTTAFIEGLCEFNNKIYAGCGGYFSLNGTGTAIFYDTGTTFADEFVTILQPCRWVTSGGSGSGQSADASAGDPRTLLLSDTITYGTRMIIGAGTFSFSNGAQVDLNGHASGGDPTALTVIEGVSKDATNIDLAAGAALTYLLVWGSSSGNTQGNVLFRNIKLTSSKATATILYAGYTGDLSNTIYLRDMSLGDITKTVSACSDIYSNLNIKRTMVDNLNGPGITDDGGDFYGDYNIIRVGNSTCFNFNAAGSGITLYNTVLYFGTNGIWTRAGANVVPIAKNCIFYGDGTATGILDDASLAEDGSTYLNNILYNCTATANVANFSATNKTNTNPKFLNAGTDFHIIGGSPAYHAGTNLSLTKDFAGNSVSSTPSIGAYENALGGGGLTSGLGLSGGNAPPWMRRKNQ